MTMSWHTMMEFTPPLVGCVISNRNFTFDLLKTTRNCVINIPTVELAEKVVGCGNTSGLTLATMMALRDAGDPLPTAPIPISAWADLAHTGETMKTRADVDPIAGGDAMDALVMAYLQGRKPQETPLGSPLYGDFSGLPPLLFHVGDAETLLDDSRRCHEKAKAAGVDSQIEVWDDMPHVWHLFAPYLPQASQAIDRIGEFVRGHS